MKQRLYERRIRVQAVWKLDNLCRVDSPVLLKVHCLRVFVLTGAVSFQCVLRL